MAKTLEEHHGYLADRVKIAQYQAAIDRAVHPEHTVLDLGCGSGLLGLMALRAGASKVYFVEEGSVLEVARQTIMNAGFAGKSEFFLANSFELTLPERVDVVICDHVGYFGFDYGILGLLSDARQRFLKPGGVLIPEEIKLQVAPIESEACRQLVDRWRDGSVPEDFTWLGTAAANTKHRMHLNGAELLADAAPIATLALGTEAQPFLSWNAEFRCTRDGTLDGIAGWFDCRLAKGVQMTNSPVAAERLNRPLAFLPIERPVPVSEGEPVNVTVMARHLDNVIGWVAELPASDQRFSQTTFNGLLLDHDALTRAHPERLATLNERGRARQIVLSYCDGARTVAEVQAMIQRDQPDLFPSPQAASAFVMQVLSWDTGE